MKALPLSLGLVATIAIAIASTAVCAAQSVTIGEVTFPLGDAAFPDDVQCLGAGGCGGDYLFYTGPPGYTYIGILNAAPPTPLEAWRALHFSATDLADPAKEATVWGNDADPDRDGNRNWKEYVFGGNPLDPSDADLHVSAEVTTGAGGESVLEITYRQRTNDPALAFTHEVTAGLQAWRSGPAYTAVVNTNPINGEILQITFKDTGLGVTDGRYFGRVIATGP